MSKKQDNIIRRNLAVHAYIMNNLLSEQPTLTRESASKEAYNRLRTIPAKHRQIIYDIYIAKKEN